MPARPPREEIRIGIASCLLGHKVRCDGGHKKDSLVTGALSKFMTFVPVCPEVEVGMPVPRPWTCRHPPAQIQQVKITPGQVG